MIGLNENHASTWRLTLRVGTTERRALERTCHAFAGACEHVRAVGRSEGTAGAVRLQALCYADLRQRFGLQANLAIRAVARAATALKVGAEEALAPNRVDYDRRVLSILPHEHSVSLATVEGRLRGVPAVADGGRWPARGAFRRATLLHGDGAFVLLVWGDPQGTVTLSKWSPP